MKLILIIFKWILSLRYHVTLKGEQHLKKYDTVLVLPNHVALVDPQLVMAHLGVHHPLHPVVQASFFNAPGLHWLFKKIGAISINNSSSDALSSQDVQKSFDSITDALASQKSVLLYPAGGLKKQALESIIGKKTTYHVMQHIPEHVGVLGVRITGLWGSSASKAWHGETPSLMWVICKGLWYMIANLIFFIPKRSVDIEIVDITHEAQKHAKASLDAFNHRLETFYNKKGAEALEYQQHYFYYNDVADKHFPETANGSVDAMHQVADYSKLQYDPHILEVIVQKIHGMKPGYDKEISLSTHVLFDLYFDSLDTAELKSFVQEQFPEASNPPLLDLKIIGDYVLMALGQSLHVDALKPCHWYYPETNEQLRVVAESWTEKDSILSAMKTIFHRHRSYSFCYDNVFGVQSRRDYMIKAYLIADLLRQFPGQYIGIMLPALTGTSLMITAAYLAEKTPVMLNWTLGELAFQHCAAYKNVPAILTSRKFYNKIKAPHYEQYNLVFLEDLLKKISLKQKLKAVFNAQRFSLPPQHEEAVILFTSGSEALPKPVSITHQNVLQNIKGALSLLTVEKDDIFLGFLPPFHSFGFTVNTILPLITGLRVVYSPDPNDSKTLANVIEHTKVTGVASTPTFMKRVLASARASQMTSLKFMITGAEKAPQALFDTIHTMVPAAKIIEGYGITECSPIISANPMERPKPGTVGLPIAGLSLKILDIETQVEKNPGQEGMIYVSGPSVFSGYGDPKLADPFIMFEGNKYYKTGDLGYVDNDGYLTITGRLKRFVKIAGEMISLPFVENVLLEKYGNPEEVTLAVEGKEYPDGTAKLVVFTTVDGLQVSDLNAYLRTKGVSNVIRIHSVQKVSIIPILGTGKTDYKILKNMIE